MVNEHTRRNLSGFTSIRSVSMKRRTVKAQTMPPQQAACLRAIRAGKATKTHIAVAAGLSLNHTQANLDALRTRGLIERDPLNRTWVLTDKGQTWVADIGRAPAEDARPSKQACTARPTDGSGCTLVNCRSARNSSVGQSVEVCLGSAAPTRTSRFRSSASRPR